MIDDNLEVLFGLPEDIIEGLRNGTYKRWGGAIRHQKGYFVYHLRETGQDSLENINRMLPQMQEQMKLLNLTGKITATSSILNLSVSTIGFIYLSHKVNKIEKKLEQLDIKLDQILNVVENSNEKIDAMVMSKLKNAMELASRALARENMEYAREDFRDARKLFAESKFIYQSILEGMMKKKEFLKSTDVFMDFFSLYLISCVGEIKCSLYLSDYEAAHFNINTAKDFIKLIDLNFKEHINLRNLEFIRMTGNAMVELKNIKLHLKETDARLYSFKEEIKLLESQGIGYLEWERIPLKTDAPIVFIRAIDA